MHKRIQNELSYHLSPSTLEWALLLLALITAVLLRFWRLDQLPPGLYRDEAINGLDALKVLKGQFPLYFPANNGREPLFIYLTAVAISFFGQTVFALRLTAALVGSLTTIPVFLLGRSWFGWRVGIFSAWLWAITLWPVHLSRLGLRIILLVPLLTLAFWLGTTAYRRQKNWIWALAGVMYGLTFYTYLAARITPLLLIFLGLFLLWKKERKRLWPGIAVFSVAVLVVMLPLFYLTWQQPDWLLGRTGQVSILHPDVHGGDPLGALAGNILATLGMFNVRGDSILRHNPVGRPVFDLFMLVPFLIGLIWCIKSWRKPAAITVLAWTGVMLLSTMLAADAPHFLRAVGVLPAIVFFPAIGLDWLWRRDRITQTGRLLLVGGLILGSLLLTIRDYRAYGENAEVGYYFEAAAVDLAQQLNGEEPGTAIYLDERFWSNWPSLSFLVTDDDRVVRYLSASDLPEQIDLPAAIYAWPYESLEFIPETLLDAQLITVDEGSLARGDLDDLAYPLFVRYAGGDFPGDLAAPAAQFGDQLILRRADVEILDENQLQIDLYWQADYPVDENLTVFIHVNGDTGLVGQDDRPAAGGRWPNSWWQPELLLRDRHIVDLSEPYDAAQHQLSLGLYITGSGQRLPLLEPESGELLGDSWQLEAE